MANIKDPFGSYKSQKILVSKSLNDLGSNLESANYIRSTVKEQQEFEPHVDYTTASNFARYGSAEQYYKDAFSYIQDEYPYDGSGKEKVDWEIQASGLDRYIFEKEYPRTSGHITMGTANAAAGTQTSGYFLPGTLEYIIITGSYQPAKGAKTLRTDWDKYNLYDTSSGGNYNLEINGDNGVAVEFWWKKDSYAGQDSSRQVILDLWNRGTTQASVGVESTGEDWGRFTVEIDPGNYHSGSSDSRAKFWLRVFSGSDGLSSSSYWRTTGKDHGGDSTHTCIPIGQNLTLTGANWTHYGFNIYNTGSEMAAELYVNGTLNERIITGSSINPVTGAMISTIGSLVTNTYGGTAPAFSGWLSASLDEFRYWRRKRTAAQIGQYWFTQVGGGTNTDITNAYNAPTKYSYTNPVDLGVYYKFNEGILNSSSINPGDKTVLDYSGRVSNGNWVGYTATARSTASAIIDGGAATSEFKDPILYSSHPDVSLKFEELKLKGFEHDINNNAAIFQSVPGWIRDEDIANDGNTLLKLTQIIASYFDTLQLQIQNLPRLRDVEYLSSSYKPLPFTSRLIDSTGLDSAELFADASEFEALAARDDFRTFSEKLNETKNKIYQNLYNNLVYIFKSKGTAKSIRNLIRCYGVGDELVKLNLYADQVTSDIKENYESSITRKKYVNFYETGSFNASVYQDATVTDDGTGGSSNTNVKSTLSSSTDAIYQGNTLETEIIFPEKRSGDNPISFTTTFITSSLFGVHTVTGATNTTWAPHDSANFQVSAIRGGHTANDAYFKLSSTTGGSFPTLTSSIIKDVYNNSRWNMAVRIKPTSYPWTNAIDGTELSQAYDIEFLGYQTLLDSVENQFKLTGSISFANGQSFLSSSKRVFAGAHRTNFNSTVLQQSDVKISSVRYWNDYLEDKVILAHARDPSNFGRLHPGQNKNLNQVGRSFADNVFQIPQMETLALQWNFDTVTGSDTNGEFIVEDYSSGSIDAANPYGFLNQDTKYRHPGKGIGFPTSNADVTVREYVYTAKQQLPEVISSDDMIDIKTESDVEISIRDTRPIRFFFAVEKSLYASVSAEMIKFFATVLDFNNLIGEPVNRYRQDYKALEKMRQLFFERVQNDTVDFEKFVDYFKWIDESIGKMVVQLFPVTANFSRKVFTMIESHVLERNKYWNKFPTLEMKAADPEAGLYGINEMLYSWKRGKGQVQRQASFDNLLTFAGHSINDKFTVNVPTAGGVPGVDITVKLVSGTPSAATANQVEVSTAGTTAAILARFVIAIAGGTPSPSNSVAYGSGAGDATNGIAGITAALGTNPTITVTATREGAAGNDIVFTDVVGTMVAGGGAGSSPANLAGGLGNANVNCLWWNERVERGNDVITSGDSTVDGQRDKFRLANDFRSGSGPTLAISRNSTSTRTTYKGQAYALRNFTKIYRFAVDESPEIHGGSSFPRAKTIQYTHETLKFGSTEQLEIAASSIAYEKDCNDVIDPNLKNRLEYKLENTTDKEGYVSGKGTIFAPFSLFSSSVGTGYMSDVSTNFKANTDITNYHDDSYGNEKETPLQGPFTERHVGGRQYRHANINTASTDTTLTRAEAWNLSLASNILTISNRASSTPRATMLRDETAKRPLNIRNIKWGTYIPHTGNVGAVASGAFAGNYREDYEIIQTSGRTLNNRFFVKNEGFSPAVVVSPYVSGVIDFSLPRYDLTGANKSIFVERFSAPGGPEVNSRGALDIYAEEYSVYNELNNRNLIVRNALKSWQTEHCGPFGIDPTGSQGDKTIPGEHTAHPLSYDGVIAAYHKVNRNAAQYSLIKSGYDRSVNWTNLVGNITYTRSTSEIKRISGTGWDASAAGTEKLDRNGYLSFEITTVGASVIVGLNSNPTNGSSYTDMPYSIQIVTSGPVVNVWENGTAVQNPVSGLTPAVGDIFRILRKNEKIYYQRSTDSGKNFITFYTSTQLSPTDLYPDITLHAANSAVKNVKISNPRYDNWFIQHPIPQSELQYAWINASYDVSQSQPLGLLGSPDGGRTNFSVPTGSTTSSFSGTVVQFISQSCFDPDWNPPCAYVVNFAQYWTLPPAYLDQTRYRYTVSSSTNTLTPAAYWVAHQGQSINAFFNNINGPYGYPSWKQIRTGENPVPRYQKRNNIITVTKQVPTGPREIGEFRMEEFGTIKAIPIFDGGVDQAVTTRYTEPMVTFKYKPLQTTLRERVVTEDDVRAGRAPTVRNKVTFRHTFCNNLYFFANDDLTEDFNLPSRQRDNPSFQSTQTSLIQFHDLLYNRYSIDGNLFVKLIYTETSFPREVNTGLARTRGRTRYSENAPLNGVFAVPDHGHNGIDRNSSNRRTFWSNKW